MVQESQEKARYLGAASAYGFKGASLKKKDALSLDTCFRITLQVKSTNDVELTERLQEKEQALVVQYFC